MNEKVLNSKLAANAMCRAAKSAQKKAAELNLRLPMWKAGRIVFIEPKEILTKNKADAKKSNREGGGQIFIVDKAGQEMI